MGQWRLLRSPKSCDLTNYRFQIYAELGAIARNLLTANSWADAKCKQLYYNIFCLYSIAMSLPVSESLLYPAMIERRGALCWTLEIDPEQRRWGHPERHTVGDLQKVGALYPFGHFDVALVNGVFGWGLDTVDGQNEAVAGLARIMKPGGMLMLGWNTDRSSDPTKLPAIEQFFIPSHCPGLAGRITIPEVTHVYDFLLLRDRYNMAN
jgi:SAM-dependent methyltransferase